MNFADEVESKEGDSENEEEKFILLEVGRQCDTDTREAIYKLRHILEATWNRQIAIRRELRAHEKEQKEQREGTEFFYHVLRDTVRGQESRLASTEKKL